MEFTGIMNSLKKANNVNCSSDTTPLRRFETGGSDSPTSTCPSGDGTSLIFCVTGGDSELLDKVRTISECSDDKIPVKDSSNHSEKSENSNVTIRIGTDTSSLCSPNKMITCNTHNHTVHSNNNNNNKNNINNNTNDNCSHHNLNKKHDNPHPHHHHHHHHHHVNINESFMERYNLRTLSTNGSKSRPSNELCGTRKVCYRVIWDVMCLACVGLAIMGFSSWGVPYQRGFFCDDESIGYPYRDSTVPGLVLYLVCLVIPIALIVSIEFFRTYYVLQQQQQQQQPQQQMEQQHDQHSFDVGLVTKKENNSNYSLWHFNVPEWLTECYKHIGLFIFGAGICDLTTNITKYSVGRLRPHFLAICQPIMSDGTNCDYAQNQGRYIEDFTCDRSLEHSDRMLRNVHLSFPSAHASFTCFTMIYIAIYLEDRLTGWRLKFLRHLLQFIFLMFAWYTSLTRVSDYKHHWTDVLTGALIGSFYALIMVRAAHRP